tara:strand:- start:583 stop:822 length:240 start_codon:yes stop_codon:yes gene_type:complete
VSNITVLKQLSVNIKTQLNEVITMKNIKATAFGLLLTACAGVVLSCAVTLIEVKQNELKHCRDSLVGYSELERKSECRG